MHLADAFIQSDLQWIQVILFFFWGGGGYPFKSTAGYDLMNDYTLKAYKPTQTKLTNVVMTCNPTTTWTIVQRIYCCCDGFFCSPLP